MDFLCEQNTEEDQVDEALQTFVKKTDQLHSDVLKVCIRELYFEFYYTNEAQLFFSFILDTRLSRKRWFRYYPNPESR